MRLGRTLTHTKRELGVTHELQQGGGQPGQNDVVLDPQVSEVRGLGLHESLSTLQVPLFSAPSPWTHCCRGSNNG